MIDFIKKIKNGPKNSFSIQEANGTHSLTPAEIRILLPQLPSPDARYHSGEAMFEVYLAKEIFTKFWRHPVLKDITLSARSSYSAYGNRPSFDDYDSKAAIYLVRSIYRSPLDNDDSFLEEWLSIRMVPGDGKPVGGGELEIYLYKDKPVSSWLSKRFLKESGKKDFWHYVASSSRMCGVHPYFRNREDEKETEFILSKKHRYTGVSFALIHLQFLLDHPPTEFPYQYITAIIRNEFAQKGLSITQKGLTLSQDGKEVGPTFTPAFEFLGLKNKDEIQLDRSVYAYEFPLYWFNKEELVALLEKLVVSNQLPSDALDLRHLGKLLTIDGKIPNSALTGEALRQMVDAHVQAMPELKVTEAKHWYQSLNDMLSSAGIHIPEISKLINAYPLNF